MSICTTVPLLFLLCAGCTFAQSVPPSPDRPSHFAGEQLIEEAAKTLLESRFSLDSDRTYQLAELINLAEEHNPETRVAWEMARAQIATLELTSRPFKIALNASGLLSELPRERVSKEAFIRMLLLRTRDCDPEAASAPARATEK